MFTFNNSYQHWLNYSQIGMESDSRCFYTLNNIILHWIKHYGEWSNGWWFIYMYTNAWIWPDQNIRGRESYLFTMYEIKVSDPKKLRDVNQMVMINVMQTILPVTKSSANCLSCRLRPGWTVGRSFMTYKSHSFVVVVVVFFTFCKVLLLHVALLWLPRLRSWK